MFSWPVKRRELDCFQWQSQLSKKEDRKFTAALRKNKADKFLVAYSQDKGHVDDEK